MRFPISLMLATVLALHTPQAFADGWRDKLSKGAAKTADVVKKTARHVDDTIDSTIELAKGEATPAQTRQKLDTMSGETLARLFAENPPTLQQFLASGGYAVFDTRKSTILGITAGFGRGVAVLPTTGARTYMKMGTGGLGLSLGLGGFASQVVILFETPADLEVFTRYGYDASADTGAMFGDDKVRQTLKFENGRSIFILTNKGWKVSATAAGTRYWADPALN